MEIDIQIFHPFNVVDTCSIWNIISSPILLSASIEAKCFFSMTKYVEYECLFKTRKKFKQPDEDLKGKLHSYILKKYFQSCNLSIGDLQEIELLRNRKRLGLGELSSIAFAKRTNQCFITDDQNARKFAKEILGKGRAQTTPHLLGWLMFNQNLSEGDLASIISDHKSFDRPLEYHFKEVTEESFRVKLMVK